MRKDTDTDMEINKIYLGDASGRLNPGIRELIEDLAKDILRQENDAAMRLIESRCPYCRYAKTCNPKKGAEGFSIRYGAPGDTMACEIRFACSKGRPRKTPIPFEETRISKIAKGDKE